MNVYRLMAYILQVRYTFIKPMDGDPIQKRNTGSIDRNSNYAYQ